MPRAVPNALRQLCALLLLFLPALAALAREPVVLQLKWEHEFQFAGYYAALWQGFYAREGLDVEIRPATTPAGELLDPVVELREGRAQFAVGALDILVARGRGEDLVVVAPVFQRSPVAALTLADSGVRTPLDLATRRIASYEGAYTIAELRAMLSAHGVDSGALRLVQAPPTVDTLVAGKADVIVSYEVSARTRARELGVELQALRPAEYGVDAYGDTLYTTGALARAEPGLVARFRRASLEGWRYALEHAPEVAGRISAELPRYMIEYRDVAAYNRAFAGVARDYTGYPAVALGASDRDRWQRTYMLLLDGGLIETPFDIDSLLLPAGDAAPAPGGARVPPRLARVVATGLGALALVLASMYWWRRRPRVAAAALAVLVVAGAGLLETRFREQRASERRFELLERLGALRSRLESVIANNLSLTNGLAAFVAANPDLSQEEFAAYARNVLAREPSLRNLAAAPDLVVRYVYPHKGNEAVLGLDYRAAPAQREVAERVLQTGDLVVAGPVELVQGGMALIGSAPVYIDTPGRPRVTWGLVSAPIDVHKVLQQAGLEAPLPDGLRIAIRGKDGKGERGEVFHGDAAVFGSADAVTLPVHIGGGSWQLAAVPDEEDLRTRYGAWVIRLFALVLLGLVLIALRASARARVREREYAVALERQANFDPLTGLPSRTLFRQQLESAIARSGRTGARHALLFIDLDEFKSVNDNLGHDAGDQLLIEVGRRICGCVRASDTVARLSGDEFTAILYDIVAQESISRVAEAIVEAMGRAFRIGEHEVFCGASVGVAVYPDDAGSADALVIKADQAMYAVKRSGRNGWFFYTREMQEKSERRHRLYNELVAALDNGRIAAHLQPIVSVQTGRIVSCEALARWQREDGSWVSPGEFVPVAEESGLINRVDFVVMQTAIDAVRDINERLGTGIGLSVNVSPRIFSSQNQQMQRWMDTVKAAGRDLRLSVEITERLLFADPAEAHKALNELAASGIGISIDDFGTGNASLIHLTRFPVGIIKIDRSFTRAIGFGRAEEALIETILVMAGRLDLRVVAEGVETAEQYEYLRARNCDFVQGYFVGRPVNAAGFLELARDAGAASHAG